MSSNPEFDRNIWLELTPNRMISAVIVLGLFLMLSLVMNDYQLLKSTAYPALLFFLFFTGVWGTKVAAGSVYDEVVGRTWEWQRMSGLDPWSMTWGKLYGSTIFAWFGGVICLLVTIIGFFNDNTMLRDWQLLLLAVLGVLFSHALALLLNLLYIRSRPLERAQSGGSLYMLVLLMLLAMSWVIGSATREQILWYGHVVSLLDFIIVTTLFAWFWSVIGAYRVMRREFLYSAKPWVWSLFLAFLALFFGGLTANSTMEWFLSAFFFWWAATLLVLFVENKDPVILRGLLNAWSKGDINRVLLLIPSWLTSLIFVLVAAVVLFVMSDQQWQWKPGHYLPVGLVIFTLLMFLIRDVAIFLLLGFFAKSKRPEVTAVVYLMVLYLLIPWLLKLLSLDPITAFFVPRPDFQTVLAVGGSMTGAAIALGVLVIQWRRVSAPAD